MSIRPGPDCWRETDALFERVLKLDPSERDRFLAALPDTDETTTLEVRALLRADARASGFLGPTAQAIVARVFGQAIQARLIP